MTSSPPTSPPQQPSPPSSTGGYDRVWGLTRFSQHSSDEVIQAGKLRNVGVVQDGEILSRTTAALRRDPEVVARNEGERSQTKAREDDVVVRRKIKDEI